MNFGASPLITLRTQTCLTGDTTDRLTGVDLAKAVTIQVESVSSVYKTVLKLTKSSVSPTN